ncbi:bifunctional 3-oxoadipate enol-lactonase/4-carboxymuconolactone decarboxylase PcaDC [Spirosoma pollinicola]|uniref:AraC family transcriptional regulator n=1 Tax=Spirosoma pollinicola TaxID=2057025 RepID=A0A2K8YS49_9BACT|nr:3-oxoadipate enol-lactonase [Spirosoma pollinicola]AUD00446.1 AraC family transcriptional regulator [Spirosoma pollinicola]
MPTIVANSIPINYQLDGDTSKPVLVLSHSLGTDLSMWDAVLPLLLPHVQVLRYDTRGHGQSSVTSEPYSIDLLGADVIALLDALRLQEVCFCGLSMGGLIGQWLAIYHPERIKSLILSNTAAKIGTLENWSQRIDAVHRDGLAPLWPGVEERWFTKSFSDKTTIDQVKTVFTSSSAEGYANACAAVRDADFREQLSEIALPTLVIAGTYDPATPLADGAFLADTIPGALLVELPTAHLASVEAPEAFVSAVLRLLTQPEATRYEAGMVVRRAVLGNAHVDRAEAGKTNFDSDFQQYITESAWGSIWTRPGLTQRERSLITIAILAALGHEEELAMHIRATRNTGATPDDIKEVLMHTAVYAGVPAANTAIRIAKQVFSAENP